ncbi:MAG TPA: nucleotide exchange factor GrpE [Candidatus Magasanikbacteria bacterium]|nr:nucleotide exchange factor GrpE [Candidatus Magasanikbacteria bacterium]
MSDTQTSPVQQPEEQNETISDMEKIQHECEEYKLGWQRAVADYQNLKKEMESNRLDLFNWSEEKILSEFIPIYDNFKKAFAHHPELDGGDEFHKKVQNWVNGIGFIKKQFEDVLKNHGVEEIKTEGKFDPHLHDAVTEEDSELEHGSIIRAVESGYIMKGKVIKVAKVVVSKG